MVLHMSRDIYKIYNFTNIREAHQLEFLKNILLSLKKVKFKEAHKEKEGK